VVPTSRWGTGADSAEGELLAFISLLLFFLVKEAWLVKKTYIFIPLAERMTHIWTRQTGGFAVYQRTRGARYAAVLVGLGGQWAGCDGEEGEEEGGDCELHLGG